MITTPPSVLLQLRRLTPQREDVTFNEALHIAELQATRLVQIVGDGENLRESDIADLPRIEVIYEPLQVAGLSHWNGLRWVISINRQDTWTRQRHTLLREFKHIVDYGRSAQLYRGSSAATPVEQAEYAADYFAGCALVPKRCLKAAWGQGIQRLDDLAGHFGVDADAMADRLAQTGLNAACDGSATARCAGSISAAPSDIPGGFKVTRTCQSQEVGT